MSKSDDQGHDLDLNVVTLTQGRDLDLRSKVKVTLNHSANSDNQSTVITVKVRLSMPLMVPVYDIKHGTKKSYTISGI